MSPRWSYPSRKNRISICSDSRASSAARLTGTNDEVAGLAVGSVLWRFRVLWPSAIRTMDDIRDLPSSTEGAIKTDENCRDQRVAVGKIIFALQQLGLCRDDIQEVDRTLGVTLPGGLQSVPIFSDGPGNIG